MFKFWKKKSNTPPVAVPVETNISYFSIEAALSNLEKFKKEKQKKSLNLLISEFNDGIKESTEAGLPYRYMDMVNIDPESHNAFVNGLQHMGYEVTCTITNKNVSTTEYKYRIFVPKGN